MNISIHTAWNTFMQEGSLGVRIPELLNHLWVQTWLPKRTSKRKPRCVEWVECMTFFIMGYVKQNLKERYGQVFRLNPICRMQAKFVHILRAASQDYKCMHGIIWILRTAQIIFDSFTTANLSPMYGLTWRRTKIEIYKSMSKKKLSWHIYNSISLFACVYKTISK